MARMHFAHNCLLFGPHSIPSPRHQPLFCPPLEYPPQISPARYAAAHWCCCQKISRHKLDRIKSRYGTLWPGGTYSAPVLRGNENSQHLVLTQMSYFVSLFRSSKNVSFKRKSASKISFEHAVFFCWKILYGKSCIINSGPDLPILGWRHSDTLKHHTSVHGPLGHPPALPGFWTR